MSSRHMTIDELHDRLDLMADIFMNHGLHRYRRREIVYLALLAAEVDGWISAKNIFEIVDYFQTAIGLTFRRFTQQSTGFQMSGLDFEHILNPSRWLVNICDLETALYPSAYAMYEDFIRRVE